MSVFRPKCDSFDEEMAKTEFFWEKAKMSLLYAYYAATLCKKPEQTYERILRSKMYVRTDERTDERTDGGEFKGPNRLRRGTKNIISQVFSTLSFLIDNSIYKNGGGLVERYNFLFLYMFGAFSGGNAIKNAEIVVFLWFWFKVCYQSF